MQGDVIVQRSVDRAGAKSIGHGEQTKTDERPDLCIAKQGKSSHQDAEGRHAPGSEF